MIGTASNLYDIFKLWNQNGVLLNLDNLAVLGLCESSVSFVILMRSVNKKCH